MTQPRSLRDCNKRSLCDEGLLAVSSYPRCAVRRRCVERTTPLARSVYSDCDTKPVAVFHQDVSQRNIIIHHCGVGGINSLYSYRFFGWVDFFFGDLKFSCARLCDVCTFFFRRILGAVLPNSPSVSRSREAGSFLVCPFVLHILYMKTSVSLQS